MSPVTELRRTIVSSLAIDIGVRFLCKFQVILLRQFLQPEFLCQPGLGGVGLLRLLLLLQLLQPRRFGCLLLFSDLLGQRLLFFYLNLSLLFLVFIFFFFRLSIPGVLEKVADRIFLF